MTAELIDGKVIAADIKKKLKRDIEKLKLTPGLAVILVGEDPASRLYVKMKRRACGEIGVYSDVNRLPVTASKGDILALIEKLNADPQIHGILVQLPLPGEIDEREILEQIAVEKDVDGLTITNMGKLFLGHGHLFPCTPRGIIRLIKSTGEELGGKHAVVVGRSDHVGKPVSMLLQRENCTVTMCHSRTQPLADYTKQADILVAAVGKPKLIKADMVKVGAVVIDVGINQLEDGSLCGDVDFEAVKEKAAHITPVPGGVGPMTIASLMENVVESAVRASQ